VLTHLKALNCNVKDTHYKDLQSLEVKVKGEKARAKIAISNTWIQGKKDNKPPFEEL
jgi:hypothetical protein